MLKFYIEPKFGDLPKGQPTSTVIANSVPIGINDLANPYVSSFHYCEVRESTLMYIVPTYQATEGNVATIAYFNDTTDKWTTVAGKTPLEQIVCDDGIYGGSGSTTVNISAYNPSTTIATSTDIKVYGAISAGEVLISLLLFCLIIFIVTTTFISALDRIKTKKKYIAYKHNEVEITDVL
jgi:hypothetical protein